MTTTWNWQRLTERIDDDAQVWPAVEAAIDAGDDPWDALIGALDDAGALAYLQSDDTGMELTDALAQLPRVFKEQPDLGAVTDTDDLEDAIRIADALLAVADLRLIRLDEEDPDAYALVVVPAASLAEITALAPELGHAVTEFD